MINNAEDARKLTIAAQSIQSVLEGIDFAASHGQRSWMFHYLPDDVSEELVKRGFTLEYPNQESHFVNVCW